MGLTALSLVAPGDTITSAQQNIVKNNFGVLDSRTGGDPGASGKIPVSNGAASAAWTGVGPAVVTGLGYLPANAAGQAFTGSISAPSVVAGAGGISSSAGVAAVDVVASNLVQAGLFTGGTTTNGSVAALSLNAGTGGIASAGPFSATAAIVSGAVQGTQLKSTVATGTAPLDVVSTTVVPNLNASLLRGAQPSTVSVAGVIVQADGAGKIDSGFLPATTVYSPTAGEVSMMAAASLTAAHANGWLTCDGSAVSRTTHSALFTAIGTAFGVGNGSTTFNVPDMRGFFPMGASGSHALASTGGSETFNNQHNHSGAPMTVSGTAAASASTLNGRFTAGGANTLPDNHTHAVSGTVGGNTADSGSSTQSVLNPFVALSFVIYSSVAT